MFRGGLGKGKACFFLYEVDTCLGIVAEGPYQNHIYVAYM